MKQSKLLVIGMTGNSGSGKSTVATYFKDAYNVNVIDGDKIGHQMLEKDSPAFDELVQQFGEGVIDDVTGHISREKLRSIVFADSKQLSALDRISHYHICKFIFNQIHEIKTYQSLKYSAIIVDAVKLLESDLIHYTDTIWVVISDIEKRKERLLNRDGLSIEAIEKRLASQWKNKEYIERADEIISNDTNLDELFKACDALAVKYNLQSSL
ncbi:dephospho-CoA kinase [Vallitalea okinawensis]|uniref:dephospho-CoA kinase n=1 Tax=Vallitalea okinawensis TaxID=2078660 RepID=UPI000CFD9000|nr:dephospho-CoA kinase [Vallitalea okinawensis]